MSLINAGHDYMPGATPSAQTMGISVSCHNNPATYIRTRLFYRCRNWGPGKWSDLRKFVQLLNGGMWNLYKWQSSLPPAGLIFDMEYTSHSFQFLPTQATVAGPLLNPPQVLPAWEDTLCRAGQPEGPSKPGSDIASQLKKWLKPPCHVDQ